MTIADLYNSAILIPPSQSAVERGLHRTTRL